MLGANFKGGHQGGWGGGGGGVWQELKAWVGGKGKKDEDLVLRWPA